MEVILLKDVAKVGRRAEVVTVSEGYAINFLIPKGMAKAATPSARRELESKKGIESKNQAENEGKVVESLKAIDGKSITIRMKANDEGHLFARLHKDAIASAIYDQLGVCIANDLVPVDGIKNIGTHEVTLSAHGARATVTLLLEREA